MSRTDPADIGMLLFGRVRNRATCFGDNQKCAFNNVLSAPISSELLEAQRPGRFRDAIHRDGHVVESDARIARHQKT
jgi:hypothetical protein